MTMFTDQPGRVFAVAVFSPLLIYKAMMYHDITLGILGAMLFTWDLFWLIKHTPKAIDIDFEIKKNR